MREAGGWGKLAITVSIDVSVVTSRHLQAVAAAVQKTEAGSTALPQRSNIVT